MAREKIDYLKVGRHGAGLTGEFGWAFTKTGATYALWWDPAWPDESTAVDHVRRSMWISLLREAMTNGWDVEFLTENAYSVKVLTIKVYAP